MTVPDFFRQLQLYAGSGFPGFYVQAAEPLEARQAILDYFAPAKADRPSRCSTLLTWDLANAGQAQPDGSPIEGNEMDFSDPIKFRPVTDLLHSRAGNTVLVCLDVHKLIEDPMATRRLIWALNAAESTQSLVIMIGPPVTLPAELARLVTQLDYPLPEKEELRDLLTDVVNGVVGDNGPVLPDPFEVEEILETAEGLSRMEARNAFALAVRCRRREDNVIRVEPVAKYKAKAIKNVPGLELLETGWGFDSLGGLEALKRYALRTLLYPLPQSDEARPKGIVLAGFEGTGKSSFARALGFEVGRTTINFNVGGIMNSLVGQSEQQFETAWNCLEAQRAICLIEEVDRAFAGHGTDTSGVTTRIVGRLLERMADPHSRVYTIFTANSLKTLPPALTRAGRVDAIYFLDLPTTEEQWPIWRIKAARYGLYHDHADLQELDNVIAELKAALEMRPGSVNIRRRLENAERIRDNFPAARLANEDALKAALPPCENWTGAEIEACCQQACRQGISLKEAANFITPIAKSHADRIDEVRKHAALSYRSTVQDGPYVIPTKAKPTSPTTTKTKRTLNSDDISAQN